MEEDERARSMKDFSHAANDPKDAAEIRSVAAGHARERDRHARLKNRYRQAARYPWLATEPGTSQPK